MTYKRNMRWDFECRNGHELVTQSRYEFPHTVMLEAGCPNCGQLMTLVRNPHEAPK